MYQPNSYQSQGYDPNNYASSPPHQKGYAPGPQNSRSPPPLQHPVPQHPILNFRADAASPTPQMAHHQPQGNMNYYPQQPQQQQQQQQPAGAYAPPNSNLYSQFGFNDPAAQMGMQFAGTAMAQGQAYVEQNVSRKTEMLNLYCSRINPFAHVADQSLGQCTCCQALFQR